MIYYSLWHLADKGYARLATATNISGVLLERHLLAKTSGRLLGVKTRHEPAPSFFPLNVPVPDLPKNHEIFFEVKILR